MRLMYCFYFLVASVNLLVAQDSETRARPIDFGGMVDKIQITERKSTEYSFDLLNVSLNLYTKNISGTRLFVFERLPGCAQVGIAKNLDELASRKGSFSIYSLWSTSQFVDAKEWDSFRKSIDTPRPSRKGISFLESLSTYSFEKAITLRLPINPRYSIDDSNTEKSLTQLRQLSPFYLQLENCDFNGNWFSMDEEKRLKSVSDLGHRWKGFGTLYLESFNSDPIRIELK